MSTVIDIAELQILRSLCREWVDFEYLPPIRELEKKLNISYLSIQKAIKKLEQEGFVKSERGRGVRILDKSSFIKHKKRISVLENIEYSAKKMKFPFTGLKVNIVTVLDAGLFVEEIVDPIIQELNKQKCIYERHYYTAKDYFRKPKFDGDAVIYVQPDFYRTIWSLDTPLLIITTNPDIEVESQSQFDLVSIDQIQACSLAGQLYANHGYNKAIFIGCHERKDHDVFDNLSNSRLIGFEQGFGRKLSNQHCIKMRSYTEYCGAMAVHQYQKLKVKPKAIFAATDQMALGFICGMAAYGLVSGKDYFMIGFDRLSHNSINLSNIPLTSVEVPINNMGKAAAKVLMKRFTFPNMENQKKFLQSKIYLGKTHLPTS